MHNSVCLVNVEIELSKDMIFAFLKYGNLRSVVLDSGLNVTTDGTSYYCFSRCENAMNLIQILSLGHNRNFS